MAGAECGMAFGPRRRPHSKLACGLFEIADESLSYTSEVGCGSVPWCGLRIRAHIYIYIYAVRATWGTSTREARNKYQGLIIIQLIERTPSVYDHPNDPSQSAPVKLSLDATAWLRMDSGETRTWMQKQRLRCCRRACRSASP